MTEAEGGTQSTSEATDNAAGSPLSNRFRGFMPVVIDVETGGFDARSHALLEIAAVTLTVDADGNLQIDEVVQHRVEPHPDMTCDPASLEFTGIDPHDPNRDALQEAQALQNVFTAVRRSVKSHDCTRAVIVAHNAHFDLGFVNAATERSGIKRNPFHPFSCLDTASLSALAYGQTVLSRACEAAQIPFDNSQAHSAGYDAERTALLFCGIVNRWRALGGWPLT